MSSYNENLNLNNSEYGNTHHIELKCCNEWNEYKWTTNNFCSSKGQELDSCFQNNNQIQCKNLYLEKAQYSVNEVVVTYPRVVKKRNTANKKERRRTLSINSAFSSLRRTIPNVPADTKLSKIKTLRLASSYITYLTQVLAGHQDPSTGFQAELLSSKKYGLDKKYTSYSFKASEEQMKSNSEINVTKKGRTGWPEDVWASELKQE